MPEAHVHGREALCIDCATHPDRPEHVTADGMLPVDTIRCDSCGDLLDEVHRAADVALEVVEGRAENLDVDVGTMLDAMKEVHTDA